MDEAKAKEVVKKAILEEIPEKLVEAEIINGEDIRITNDGKIVFDNLNIHTAEGIAGAMAIINYLASKYAEVQAELLFKSLSEED